MCGIFGISTSRHAKLEAKTIKQVFDQLVVLSESRGKEASGIAVEKGQRIEVFKSQLTGKKLLHDKTYQKLLNPEKFLTEEAYTVIGHSRLATHGTYLLHANNQPVITHQLVGVHNGICVNAETLWRKMPKRTRHSDVDTEAVLTFWEEQYNNGASTQEAAAKTFDILEGSATLAVLHTDVSQLTLATNTGSLFYLFKEKKFFIFASERYILEQLQKQFDVLASLKVNHLQPSFMLELNTKTLELHQASLKKKHSHKNKKKQATSPLYSVIDYSVDTTSRSEVLNKNSNSLEQLATHIPDTKKIQLIRRCRRCILPATMPLIQFNSDGICNFCENHQPITNYGKQSLEDYVLQFRSKNGEPDCIVAFSGGRDSAYGLHYIKRVLKLHPIAYTYDWGMVTDLGRKNQARMVGKLGVEHIIVSADIKAKRSNIRKNILAWLQKPDLGMVPLFMAGDKQAEFHAEELKQKTGIKLVFYCRGNELENEEFKWGHCGISNGSPKGVLHNLSLRGKLQLTLYYGKQFLRNPKYLNTSLFDTAFAYFVAYMMPLSFVYLWHYIPWDEKVITKTLKNEYGWETEEGSDVSWRIDDGSAAFYNYIFYTIQGFTENDTFRSNQVREGIITRKEALRLVAIENVPRYEALQWYFNQLDLNGEEVLSAIDAVPKLYE
jgi:glutamine---fructose-6-phosphate transaminase (isomerizing)